MALPRNRLSDFIGDSVDPGEILSRLRSTNLLLDGASDQHVLTQIRATLERAARAVAQAEYEKRTGFAVPGESRANHLMPSAIEAFLSDKGRAWYFAHPHFADHRPEVYLSLLSSRGALSTDSDRGEALMRIRCALDDAAVEYPPVEMLYAWMYPILNEPGRELLERVRRCQGLSALSQVQGTGYADRRLWIVGMVVFLVTAAITTLALK